ncbi:hypothetical protein [Amycolatopsis thailandensis]|uniref:hypothetical protein n=1 Tax=Amycolatopsis thailandensis TaxID=589330 RepID=UPI003628EF1C
MYRIIPDSEVLDQVAKLPTAALAAFSEVLAVLELTPWNGEPQHAAKPDVEVRRFHFGPGDAGQVVYLIVEHVDEVHLLRVQWLG